MKLSLFFSSSVCVAAMHYNENALRQQARRKDGALKWKIKYPKVKKGEATIYPFRGAQTYSKLDRVPVSLIATTPVSPCSLSCSHTYLQ